MLVGHALAGPPGGPAMAPPYQVERLLLVASAMQRQVADVQRALLVLLHCHPGQVLQQAHLPARVEQVVPHLPAAAAVGRQCEASRESP